MSRLISQNALISFIIPRPTPNEIYQRDQPNWFDNNLSTRQNKHVCSAIGTQFVRHNHFWPAVALHCFFEEFQCCVAVSALGYITFKHLTFVINGPPEVMRLSVDLHEDFVQVPLPVGMCAEILDTVLADLRGEKRAEPIPPEADGFVADINATSLQQNLICAVKAGTGQSLLSG